MLSFIRGTLKVDFPKTHKTLERIKLSLLIEERRGMSQGEIIDRKKIVGSDSF